MGLKRLFPLDVDVTRINSLEYVRLVLLPTLLETENQLSDFTEILKFEFGL
ncbi:hypothetical protein PCC7424_1623 [Gloeothece citriformis PCC 7424]|uniref:Uncharacterized protein n=1 Tax=Gloeothece citriformis (strain PCC 7424) TaxID=65393 RepID=B7K9U4_GLOC7|nr:hypothetical protein PCC7424_1623 [Gloeothece citriformis PCC 7424]